jgi:uncharacterized protein
MTAEQVIAQFGLKPHPEGGWYVQTFRDEPGRDGRAHSTAILFLLKAGEVSRWHRVDAVEVWHWYGGAPLLLEVKDGETRHEYRLGSHWLKGEHPHAAVPTHAWQSARSSVPGRSSAVRSRRASSSPASSWPRTARNREHAPSPRRGEVG